MRWRRGVIEALLCWINELQLQRINRLAKAQKDELRPTPPKESRGKSST
jgi:hypothetical protein